MATETHSTPEERATKRVKDYTDVLWHAATYVIINAFLWLIVPQAAFWVTVGWGIGLAFHIAYYFIGDDGPKNRRYQAFLAQERAREEQDST
ncbi:MAG: 2TM domain-containing protein [Actinomycetia bacterium]|nr:2TM domain-containing protein [Actinomycetes bacterium]